MQAKTLIQALTAAALLLFSAAQAGERWADFPVAAKATTAARIGNTVYAGLGTAGKGWYALDVSRPGAPWRALAEFPDVQRDDARAVAVNGQIYVFSGSGKLNPSDKALVTFDTAWRYDPAANAWSRLPTRAPMGLLATGAVTLDQRSILFFGGVNKAVFEGYFQDYFVAAGDDKARQDAVAAAYFDQRPQDYLFTAQVLSYDTTTHQWRNLGVDPGLPTIGTAVAVRGSQVTLVNGEIKPGLRSPGIKTVSVNGETLHWSTQTLVPPAGAAVQDGVAGAYAGYSNQALLVAGGANFPGSWAQFNAGQLWAHKGLKKTWHDQIYAQVGGQWTTAGKLPQPLGYSAYVQLDDSLLIIGGELQGGAATKEVIELRWNGKAVDLVR